MAIKIDRKLFMNWVQGILLERNRKGTCFVTDDTFLIPRFKAAEKALEAGQTIYLTEAGRVVTQMKRTERGYEESLAKKSKRL